MLDPARRKAGFTYLFIALALTWTGCALKQAPAPRVVSLIQSITDCQLQDHAQAISIIGSRPGNNAPKTALTVRYIERTLAEAGYRPLATRPAASQENPTSFNVIAEITGAIHPECVVELGAHYDTVPFSSGADDNGSGVAGVLAVARTLSTARCSKTIRFVLYCREEMDGAGSRTHVQNIRDNKNEQFEGAIVLDMIGYADRTPGSQRTPLRIPFVFWPPETGDFIGTVGNTPSSHIEKRYTTAAGKYVPELRLYSISMLGGLLKDAERGDHASYWAAGLPAILITDTANFRNPNYHQPSDALSTLDFNFMSQTARTTAATLLEWAGEAPEATNDPIRNGNVANPLTLYREPVESLPPGAVPLAKAGVGISVKDLTREEACRQIATEYWNAAIRGDHRRAAQLWCAFPSGETMHWHESFQPRKVVSLGTPYDPEGCFDNLTSLVIPTRVQFSNGRILDQNLIIVFRDIGLEPSCVIIGLWKAPA